jgi:hypothetical protein
MARFNYQKVKFYIIKGWRIVKRGSTYDSYEYVKTTYTVDDIDDVMEALQSIGSWHYFKVDSVEPVYYWD